MTDRRPITLSRAQERMLYSQLEEPSAPVRFAHTHVPALPLLLTFAVLIAGLTLGWILGP